MSPKIIVAVAFLLASGCGEPAPKNGDGNNGANNGTANNGANNGTANNGANNGPANNGTETDVWAADFDQSCGTDDQCFPVAEGDACSPCGCPNAAVSSSEEQAWTTAVGQFECPDHNNVLCGPCEQTVAVCKNGSCDLRIPVFVTNDGTFDASCSEDADCVSVPEGEICSACRCGGVGMNVAAAEAVYQMIEDAGCTPPPLGCACPVVAGAYCNDNGECVAGVRP